ncbi:MAG TPA: sporulation protein YunB [Bacillales bacterium]|nr:sporulation protein YunB [Bacillales bacterium]
MFKPKKRRGIRWPHFKIGKPLPPRHTFIITFMIFITLTLWGLWMINEGIKPTLMAYAKTKTKDIATTVANAAVTKQVKELQTKLEFLHLEKNNDGEVTAVVIDSSNVNMLMTRTTAQTQQYLKRLENGERWSFLNGDGIEVTTERKGALIYQIPLGVATNNSLLANLGPKVPVRFHVIGSVTSSLVGIAEPVRINNVFLKLFIKIHVNARAIIPFATEPVEVTTQVLVGSVMVSREAPLYYSGDGDDNGSPSIVLPSDKNSKRQFQIAP